MVEGQEQSTSFSRHPDAVWPLISYGSAVVGVALTTVAIAAIRTRLHVPNISILYLLVILALAGTVGRGPALFAALLAFLTFNYLFVPPVYTFAVREPGEWLALLIFLATALITGHLTASLRARAEEARAREQVTATLYELSRALVAKQDPESLLRLIATQVTSILRARSCEVLLPDATGSLEIRVGAATASEARMPMSESEASFVNWTFTNLHGPHPERNGAFLYVPLHTGERRLGVLRVDLGDEAARVEADGPLLAMFAAQAALALEQARLTKEETRATTLARADAAKDAVISSISHDLRTPLAVIRTAAGNLLQDGAPGTRDTQRELAAIIDEEAERLNRLVGALLDMSRIDAGELRPRQVVYPLEELVHAAIRQVSPADHARRFTVELEVDLPPVCVDPVQIEQVLVNILDNALKYSPPDSPIRVSAAVEPGSHAVRVTVENEGPAIPVGERERVFAKFYRVTAGSTASGSGLGLAIARGLVAAHGGRIWIDGGESEGTRVYFTVPVPPGPSALPGDGPAGEPR